MEKSLIRGRVKIQVKPQFVHPTFDTTPSPNLKGKKLLSVKARSRAFEPPITKKGAMLSSCIESNKDTLSIKQQ